MTNSLKKYLTPDRSTRIQTLNLSSAWQAGIAHQSLPPAIAGLLGELAAAAVLLAGNLKFDGSVVLQLQSNGPVNLVMVECTSTLGLRATAHLREGAQWPTTIDGLQGLLNQDGQGRFAVMLDPRTRPDGAQPYQGIVPLDADTVAGALEDYMRQSEQLDTRLWLAANDQYCAGLLLQRLPKEDNPSAHGPDPDAAEETWTHCTTLAGTVESDELLESPTDVLMHKLFWEDDLIAWPEQTVRWHCPCSRERVARMLQGLGRAEIDSIVAEQGQVHIDCHFCGQPYDFDAVDCATLFLDAETQTPISGSDALH